jgi:nicotinamide-nucleotide amidase
MEKERIQHAGIIVIGTEVLSGETVDTNSQYIGKKLNEIGILVRRKITIADVKEEIVAAVDDLWRCCDILILSGGLGPTNDDITKNTLSDYFDSDYIFDEDIFKGITRMLKHRVPKISDVHRNQAMIPRKAKALPNQLGTAPGLLFEKEEKCLFSLPGVPYELKGLIDRQVIPYLAKRNSSTKLISVNIKTVGIGESVIARLIKDIEDALPEYISLAYLPGIAQVKLRLTAQSSGSRNELEAEMNQLKDAIVKRISEYVYGYGDTGLFEAIGLLLKKNKKTLATAESCTGGYIAHQLTSVPGSSSYFKAALVAYANEIKEKDLGVSKEVLEQEGAVSQACVEEMARNVRIKFNTSYGLATSGIAGPDGGTPEKPVGTVWLAVASEKEVISKKIQFDRGRMQNIGFSSVIVLDMLRKEFLIKNRI